MNHVLYFENIDFKNLKLVAYNCCTFPLTLLLKVKSNSQKLMYQKII